MKIRVNKHKLNIHYRGSPWGSRTQQHAYCLRYAHSHHIESHLGKKQPQAKIAIAFLFGQLHFNNVTLHALFYRGHLFMRSKRCAVQNQGITLTLFWYKGPGELGNGLLITRKGSLTLTRFVWNTSMAANWNTNMAVVMSCKNALYCRPNTSWKRIESH